MGNLLRPNQSSRFAPHTVAVTKISNSTSNMRYTQPENWPHRNIAGFSRTLQLVPPTLHDSKRTPPQFLKGIQTMVSLQRHRLHLTCLALAIMALVVAAPIAAQASAKDPSASSVINSTRAAIANESGVHVLVTTRTTSSSSKVVADIGATSGVETITEESDEATIRVTPTYAYVSGNAAGLTTLMGLSAKEQKKVGIDAISMKVGTTPYKNLKSSITIPVLANLLPAVKGTMYSTRVIGGRQYYQLSWTTKATSSTPKSKSVLTLSEGTAVLPFREVSTSSSGTGTTTFSKWGERINVSVPPTSRIIPYSKVVS